MASRDVGHQLGEHFEAHQKSVQRIFVEFAGAPEQLVEQRVLALDVANEQGAGELGQRDAAVAPDPLEDAGAAQCRGDGAQLTVARRGPTSLPPRYFIT